MDKFLNLPEKEKVRYINEAVFSLNLPPEAIEKDIWVTAVLRALFELPYSENISFKGGTSLSKCWNVIERFSEDVDIAINREYFGFQGDTFTIKQISKSLRKAACKFCRNTLQYDVAILCAVWFCATSLRRRSLKQSSNLLIYKWIASLMLDDVAQNYTAQRI
jgi:hypothetical protein